MVLLHHDSYCHYLEIISIYLINDILMIKYIDISKGL